MLTAFTWSTPNENPDWHFTKTDNLHIIIFPEEMMLNGTIENGDYIGVFYETPEGTECGGFIPWEGTPNAILAFADDMFTPKQKEGFFPGEEITFKVWKKNTDKEINLEVQFFPKGSYNGKATHEQTFDYYGTCYVKGLSVEE